jgi:adenylate kinase
MLIYVWWIPGVGKTALVKVVVEELNRSWSIAECIRGLPILCELAGNISPDEFRLLPDHIRKQYRPQMYDIIYKRDLADFSTIRILDGHFAYFEVEKRAHSIREINKQDYIQMKGIFLVEWNSETILSRRSMDIQHRIDRHLDTEYINQQLEIERNEAIRQAKELNVPIVFIDNNGALLESIGFMLSEFRKLLK